MTTRASRALKSLKTLPADEIGILKSIKASEMSTDIRVQNHAEKVALRKQVDVWYRDQNDAVRKLSQGQQHIFKNLVKIDNEKRRLKRQAYIQKQRAVQQKLREQSIKDREGAARRFLEGSIKKGRKKVIQRQKEKEASALGDIEEEGDGAINPPAPDDNRIIPDSNGNDVGDVTLFSNGNNGDNNNSGNSNKNIGNNDNGYSYINKSSRGATQSAAGDGSLDVISNHNSAKSVNKTRHKSKLSKGDNIALTDVITESRDHKRPVADRDSVDSGVESVPDVTIESLQNSSHIISLKDEAEVREESNGLPGSKDIRPLKTSPPPQDTLLAKGERKVTFVDDEKEGKEEVDEDRGVASSLRSERSTPVWGRETTEIIEEKTNVKPVRISHHRVTVIDGDTGHVEVLPREKTRIVDETAFVRREVGGLSLAKSKKIIPQVNRAHLRPSTSDKQRQGVDNPDKDAVSMNTRSDSDLSRISAIARENGPFQNAASLISTDNNSFSRMNTTVSSTILPPIREDSLVDSNASVCNEAGKDNDNNGCHVTSDRLASSAQTRTGVDQAPAETASSPRVEAIGDSVDNNGSALGDDRRVQPDAVDIISNDDDNDHGDDDDEENKRKYRDKSMRERRKLEDDMHKYHVGIANRTFKLPKSEVSRVSHVPVYTRNSEGSLVASEKPVRLAAEDFKLPSRRQEYLIKKALEWEEARKEERETKLKKFLAKMKDTEHTIAAKTDRAIVVSRREAFRSPKQGDISHNSLRSTVFGRALQNDNMYGNGPVDTNDLNNCRYIRTTSMDDTARVGAPGEDNSYEARRRKRALDKVSSWGPLGMPHGGTSRSKKGSTRTYVSI